MENKVILELKNFTKKFGDKVILDNIDIEIKQGERVAIIGGSGEGKTTLLKCLSNPPITGYVFQEFNLFANMNVLKNITLAPIKHDYKSKKTITEKALVMLEQFGLADKAKSYPHTLSGGQKQRVAIIRALMNNPKVILFDEPTSSLDPKTKREVLEIIKSLDKDLAIIIVTHDTSLAKEFASKILLLESGKITKVNHNLV